MKRETLPSRMWFSGAAGVLACVVAVSGCEPTNDEPADPGGAGDGGESIRGTDDRAGAAHDADGGVGNVGGSAVGVAGDGGANLGAGAAETVGDAGAIGTGGAAGAPSAGEVPPEIESCLADLVGPAGDDIVAVRGNAGALGNVDYTIAGYSAGAHASDGLQRFTNSTSGQRGTPAGIDDTGLWMWTQNGPVVVGKLYASGKDVPSSAQIDFRAIAANYTALASCPAEAESSGHFIFTAFDPSLGGLELDGTLAAGGFDFQCPEADIDVRGCFRYAK